MKKVTKAVIAAAGFGTRFLPQTKAMPKEMLPLIDKPIVQYIVEQLVEAGIKEIIIVTGYHKRSIEDHFDQLSSDLRENLKQGGKNELLEATESISNLAHFAYVRQKGPYGSATPVINVCHLIGDEPFIYTYADDLIIAKPNHFTQLIEAYQKTNSTVLPCLEVTDEEGYDRYGIIAGHKDETGLVKMETIIEKPGKDKAPSNLASVGGYLFTPDIFKPLLQNLESHTKGEFQLQPTMRQMMAKGNDLYAMKIQDATYYDTGNKLEYIKTVIDFGLNDKKLGPALLEHVKTRLNNLK